MPFLDFHSSPLLSFVCDGICGSMVLSPFDGQKINSVLVEIETKIFLKLVDSVDKRA